MGQLGRGSGTFAGPGLLADAPPFVQIASQATASHVCGLTSAGTAWCWGANFHGQAGDSTHLNRFTPAEVPTSVRFTQLAVGGGFTCGVSEANALWCWGANTNGELGRPLVLRSPDPHPTLPPHP